VFVVLAELVNVFEAFEVDVLFMTPVVGWHEGTARAANIKLAKTIGPYSGIFTVLSSCTNQRGYPPRSVRDCIGLYVNQAALSFIFCDRCS